MYTSHRKSGSSLLLILLIASAASVVILAGAKLLLDSARSSATTATKNLALTMAEAGIQDGLLLYKTGAISAEYGEDTSSGDTQDLRPMRRGFTDAACTSLGDDEIARDARTYNTDCPFYDLTIRRFKEITYDENSSDPANHFYYSTRVFPHNTEVMLQNPAAQQLIIQFTVGTTTGSFAPGSQFKRCTDLACSNSAWSNITNDLIDVQPSDVAIVVKMTYDANILQSHIDEFAEVKLSGTGNIRFDRGYTTIVSRGYAGRTKLTKLVNIYPSRGWDLLWPANPAFLPTTPSYAQVDFSDCFNDNGQQVGLSAVSDKTCY